MEMLITNFKNRIYIFTTQKYTFHMDHIYILKIALPLFVFFLLIILSLYYTL